MYIISMYKCILVFVLLTGEISQADDNTYDPTLVTIKQGTLKGTQRLDRKNGVFYAFRSIPYGKSPTGNLRFMPPLKHEGWFGIYDATQDLPPCYQSLILHHSQIGTEDCLHLNVYTKNTTPGKDVPVMVFFHGGAYIQGDPTETVYNPNFLMTKDIVLVTVAYRLGILGFCSLGIGTKTPITANAGLKDQNLALTWVDDNIRKFGGNPNSVTLFGESAGAGSVTLHMFSPLSKGLFNKVIAESGIFLNGWALGKPGSCEAIAQYLQITSTDPHEILHQLQSKTAQELLAVQFSALGDLSTLIHEPSYYSPVIEGDIKGAFLPRDPRKQIMEGKYNTVPIILGYNDQEGILLDVYNILAGSFQNIYHFVNSVPYDLNINNNPVVVAEVENLITQYYFNGNLPTINDRSVKMVECVTDSWYAYGITKAAKLLAEDTDVYLYRFSANTALNFFKQFTPQTALYAGASHADELGYLFQTIFTPEILSGSLEDTLIDVMVTLWTDFAKRPSSLRSRWYRVDPYSEDLNYLSISNAGLAKLVNPDQQRMEFWIDLYKRKGQ